MRKYYRNTIIFSTNDVTMLGIMKYLLLAAMAMLGGCASVNTTGHVPVNGKPIAYSWEGNKYPPTIVLQAGLGDGKATWGDVERRLKTGVSVFAYDRPGYGDSPATATPRDPCSIAREQHQVLADAGVKPPYLLVGHSLGGLYEYTYAKLYPNEVAGMVLLDPTHPQHFARMQTEAPALAATLNTLTLLFTPTMKREFAAQTQCLDTLPANSLQNIPVRLLFSTKTDVLAQSAAFDTLRQALASDWQRLTNAAAIQNVPESGHYIQKDRPDAVVQAIDSLLQLAVAVKARLYQESLP
jgi:pimeloyl-ACP methyl ester carboxylesterase